AHASGRVLQEAVIDHDISNERLLVSSFDMEALRRFRRVAASIPIAVLTEGVPPPSFWAMAAGLSAVAVNIDIASVNASFVQEAHGRGLQIMVYTVNTQEDAARLQEMGVDGIFSDFPDRMHS
ncbi:MAG: glycerophosphodiester phosphodiesterase, partial [Gammaproteobacteria bacterium]|nr:glycerophosphodiester phosphodiesterase [Gammaproteobacteria bacterium]